MHAAKEALQTAMWVALVLFVATIAVQTAIHPVIEPATTTLAESMPALHSCLTTGRACNEVSHQPLLQQIPALLFHLSGADVQTTAAGLLWLPQILSFILFFWMLFWSMLSRREDTGSWLAAPEFLILIFLSGQMCAYYGSSFFENLTGTFAGLLCFAIAGRKRTAAFILAAALTVSRDFAAVLVLIFTIACWYVPDRARLNDLTAPVAGIVAGVVCALLFNYLRYDAPLNAFHLSPVFMSGSLTQVLKNVLAALISPNGGMLLFWTGILLLVMSGIGNTMKPIGSSGKTSLRLCLALLVMLAVGSALFDTPFGWIAWGNRNLLPWIAGCSVIAGTVFARSGDPAWLNEKVSPFFALTITLLNLPHLLAAADQSVILSVFAPTDICPGPGDVLADKARFFSCLNHYLWPDKTVLTNAFQLAQPDVTGWLLITTGTLLTASATWLLLARNFRTES